MNTLGPDSYSPGFGYDIALLQDLLVISAPYDLEGSIFIYTYIYGAWTLSQKISHPYTNEFALAGYQFGFNVEFDED